MTVSGDLLGTLRYMSPEQALAKHGLVDHRTDVYSLGATLYELLTLRPAVTGADKQELLRQLAFDEPAAPRKFDRTIPTELETVVLKALAKDPAERYQSVTELANALAPFGPPGAFSSVVTLPLNAPPLGPSTTLTDSSQDTPAAPPARRGRGIFTAAAVLLGIVLAGSLLRAWWVSRAMQADASGNAVSPAAQPVASLPVPTSAPAPAQ